MNISTLQHKVLTLFKEQNIMCNVESLGTIEVIDNGNHRRIHLYNLLREIQMYPQQYESLVQVFVQRCFESSTSGDVYPRIIAYESVKPLHHPWVENLVPDKFDVAFIRHSDGILRFLSPMDIVQSKQSLLSIKRSSIANLLPLLEMITVEERAKNVWRITHPEILTSSLLLVLSCASENHIETFAKVKMAAIPNRGTLWIGGSGLYEMETLIGSEWERVPYPISPEIFDWSMRDSERWFQSWTGQRL